MIQGCSTRICFAGPTSEFRVKSWSGAGRMGLFLRTCRLESLSVMSRVAWLKNKEPDMKLCEPTDLDLLPLPLFVPKILPIALGYPGSARYVATWWDWEVNYPILTDGRHFSAADWNSWLIYITHPANFSVLHSFNIGTPDLEATHYLVFDVMKQLAFVGQDVNVIAFLSLTHKGGLMHEKRRKRLRTFQRDEAEQTELIGKLRLTLEYQLRLN